MSDKTRNRFEEMLTEIEKEDSREELIDICMNLHMRAIKTVPLRYRLIALGFMKHLSLEEMNQKLQEEGCAKLYSRNFWEASFIFAFSHGLSYEHWKSLKSSTLPMAEEVNSSQGVPLLSGITFRDLKKYLEEASKNRNIMQTRHLTRHIEKKLLDLQGEEEEYRRFLEENLESFSTVREKTRYYFCKYLYYYLQTRMEETIRELQENRIRNYVFKGISSLNRKKTTVQEAREQLEGCHISCREIYSEFHYFYFEYISMDWMEILLEYYGQISQIPAPMKKKIADEIRSRQPRKRKLSDDEILSEKMREMEKKEEELDRIYSLESKRPGYQRNRGGEKVLRNYIKGSVDLERGVLMAFLLFFGSQSILEEDQILTRERLNEILLECGYGQLTEEDEIDRFVLQFLQEKEPREYIMDAAVTCALKGENFPFYHIYYSACSYNREFEKLIGV